MPTFKVSDRFPYKYSVITPSGKKIHFGDRRYEHYWDRTGLGWWSKLNHNNKIRRELYWKWHRGILKKDGKPSYLDPE